MFGCPGRDEPEQAFESGYPVHDRWTIAPNRVEDRPPSVEITHPERGQPALGGGRPTMPKPPHLATVSATRPLHLVVFLLTSPSHRRIVPGSPDTYRDARSAPTGRIHRSVSSPQGHIGCTRDKDELAATGTPGSASGRGEDGRWHEGPGPARRRRAARTATRPPRQPPP